MGVKVGLVLILILFLSFILLNSKGFSFWKGCSELKKSSTKMRNEAREKEKKWLPWSLKSWFVKGRREIKKFDEIEKLGSQLRKSPQDHKKYPLSAKATSKAKKSTLILKSAFGDIKKIPEIKKVWLNQEKWKSWYQKVVIDQEKSRLI